MFDDTSISPSGFSRKSQVRRQKSSRTIVTTEFRSNKTSLKEENGIVMSVCETEKKTTKKEETSAVDKTESLVYVSTNAKKKTNQNSHCREHVPSTRPSRMPSLNKQKSEGGLKLPFLNMVVSSPSRSSKISTQVCPSHLPALVDQ